MILGTGTDLTTISRIADIHRQAGARLLRRILSAEEQDVAATKTGERLDRFLARRFAAKEAVAKALGTGIGGQAFFIEISITNDDAGKPLVTLSGHAAERLATLAAGKDVAVHLSLSDEGDLAMAYAVIESL